MWISQCLFEDFQSGFRGHHSTETALVKVTNDLLTASDEELISVLVLLDWTAAFDTIDSNSLLERLELVVGIKGTALRWFNLSDRSQFVSVNNQASIHTNVTHRLSPWTNPIYLIYASSNIIRKHSINFHFYANETQIYISMKPNELNQVNTLKWEGKLI